MALEFTCKISLQKIPKMQQYLKLLKYVNDCGIKKLDRTGTGTRSVFGYQMRFDLSQNFPLLTPTKIHLKSVIYELLWFLSGDTNIKFLKDINKLGPFGNFNFLPSFLIKNLKVIKLNIIKDKHISVILKPNTGATIRAICFNCLNTKLGHYLLNYKKKINIIAQIHENIWNNKKTIQLNIKDLIL